MTPIRAIVQNGLIHPLDPMPAEWVEGHAVVVEDAESAPIEDLEDWYRELQRLGPADYEAGEWERVQAVMIEADDQAKAAVRRQMGLMLMARYLLDTNHLSAALDGRLAVRERLYRSRQARDRLGTCVPVLCELETGLYHARRRDHNRHILAVLLRQIRVWPLEPTLAPVYAEVFHDLRAKDRVLSQFDMVLAAMARSMNATLLTSDRDFDALTDLRKVLQPRA